MQYQTQMETKNNIGGGMNGGMSGGMSGGEDAGAVRMEAFDARVYFGRWFDSWFNNQLDTFMRDFIKELNGTSVRDGMDSKKLMISKSFTSLIYSSEILDFVGNIKLIAPPSRLRFSIYHSNDDMDGKIRRIVNGEDTRILNVIRDLFAYSFQTYKKKFRSESARYNNKEYELMANKLRISNGLTTKFKAFSFRNYIWYNLKRKLIHMEKVELIDEGEIKVPAKGDGWESSSSSLDVSDVDGPNVDGYEDVSTVVCMCDSFKKMFINNKVKIMNDFKNVVGGGGVCVRCYNEMTSVDEMNEIERRNDCENVRCLKCGCDVVAPISDVPYPFYETLGAWREKIFNI